MWGRLNYSIGEWWVICPSFKRCRLLKRCWLLKRCPSVKRRQHI
jgi:hypothetical protein